MPVLFWKFVVIFVFHRSVRACLGRLSDLPKRVTPFSASFESNGTNFAVKGDLFWLGSSLNATNIRLIVLPTT